MTQYRSCTFSAAFFLLLIWPVIINFSLSYESAELRSWFNLTAYVNFCLRLLLIFGLVFELPVVAAILVRKAQSLLTRKGGDP